MERCVQTGESISMSDIMWTEMACEDMQVKELLRSVLLQVKTIDWNSDSPLCLSMTSSAYIVLKKCDAKVKCIEPQDITHGDQE